MKSKAISGVPGGKWLSKGRGMSSGNSLCLYLEFMAATWSGLGVPSTLKISQIYRFESLPGKSGLILNISAITQPAAQMSIFSS